MVADAATSAGLASVERPAGFTLASGVGLGLLRARAWPAHAGRARGLTVEQLLHQARSGETEGRYLRMLARRLRWPQEQLAALNGAIRPPPATLDCAVELPNAASLEHLARVLGSLGADLTPDSVGVAADGGMGLAWARDAWYADVECLNSGEVLLVHRRRGGPNTLVELDPEALEEDSWDQPGTIREVLREHLTLGTPPG